MKNKDKKDFYNIQSRNRKSMSNSLLIYFVLKEGGNISFGKTKDSKNTLKVFTGNRIFINNIEYTMDSFEYYSTIINISFIELIKNSEYRRNSLITFSKKNILENNDEINMYAKLKYKNKIEECRAREAHFSNTMAYILLKLGYVITFNNNHLKMSNSRYHFYLFESIIDRGGEKISLSKNQDFFKSIVFSIQNKFNKINYITITIKDIELKSKLIHSDNFIQLKRNSFLLTFMEIINDKLYF